MGIDVLRKFTFLVFASWLAAPAAMATDQGVADQQRLGSVQQETAEAIEAIKQYSAAQREQALARAKALLEGLDVRIAKLETWVNQHWEPMQAAARQRAQEMLSRLEAQRADLAQAYSILEASSGSAWEDVKQGFLKSYRTMREAYDKAKSEL